MIHECDSVEFIGGENSYLMVNLLDENNEIKSSKTFHVDGEKIHPETIYTCTACSGIIKLI